MNILRPLRVLRRGVVCLLVVLAPLGGTRMVCVEDPVRPVHIVMRAAEAGCADECSLRAGGRARCSLSDANPLIGLVAFDALPPPVIATATLPSPVSYRYPDVGTLYDDPVLARFVPPPEA